MGWLQLVVFAAADTAERPARTGRPPKGSPTERFTGSPKGT